MKDPSRTLLFSGVALAAALAGAGFYLFFANVPERGAANETVVAAVPQQIDRAEIDRMIQERNAFAPRPGDTALRAKVDLARERDARAADVATMTERWAPADRTLAGASSATDTSSFETRAAAVAEEALPVAAAPVADEIDEGESMFRRGLYPEALENWRERAGAGDRWAAYRLGIELIDGKPGVAKRDVVEGAKYILQSAEANEPRAQFEMGSLYEYGTGVQADLASSSEWYRKAAERGHAQAQYNYATMLEAGEGVLEDRVEALKYYTLAAEQGFTGLAVDGAGQLQESGPTALDRLRMTLPAADVREAEQRAAAFKPIED